VRKRGVPAFGALLIESRAKMRLADEYDDAQERGEVRTRADNQHIPDQNKPSVAELGTVPAGNTAPVIAADLGINRKEIFESRQLRDAERERPGCCSKLSPSVLS
jgi:hypothetical protein